MGRTCFALAQVREAKALTQQICDFLEAEGGSAATQAVIQHFEGDVPPAKMSLFRQLLKQVLLLPPHSLSSTPPFYISLSTCVPPPFISSR